MPANISKIFMDEALTLTWTLRFILDYIIYEIYLYLFKGYTVYIKLKEENRKLN